MRVDFATFCHPGDIKKLHKSGQLKRQVESNGYQFDTVVIVHQKCSFANIESDISGEDVGKSNLFMTGINDFDSLLELFNINLNGQYVSDTDQAHTWKKHVVNHLKAVSVSHSDYIVFADGDCWMVENDDYSWVEYGMEMLKLNPDIFIISPNDGEPERHTRRMSQQMFMARTEQFRNANFNQPGWDGNTDIPGGPMPEYWGMLEGRMELYCRQTDQYRYVCPPEYRYWHHNRINSETNHYELDRSKY